MPHPLAGIDAKVKRGFDHLDEFEMKSRRFLEQDPYEIVHEFDADAGSYAGVFHIREEPPAMLGVIAGEAVGQFRSALDHLMGELVRAHRPASRKTPNFPTYSWRQYTDNASGPSHRDEIRRSVRPVHLALIDALQPKETDLSPVFANGPRSRDALAIVQWLTNVDKHEVVHPIFAWPTRILFGGHPNVRSYIAALNPPFTLDEGAKLYWVTFVDESKMQVPMDFALEMAIGPPPMVRMTIEVMRRFGKRVEGIIDDFRAVTPEFGGSPPAHSAPPGASSDGAP